MDDFPNQKLPYLSGMSHSFPLFPGISHIFGVDIGPPYRSGCHIRPQTVATCIGISRKDRQRDATQVDSEAYHAEISHSKFIYIYIHTVHIIRYMNKKYLYTCIDVYYIHSLSTFLSGKWLKVGVFKNGFRAATTIPDLHVRFHPCLKQQIENIGPWVKLIKTAQLQSFGIGFVSAWLQPEEGTH